MLLNNGVLASPVSLTLSTELYFPKLIINPVVQATSDGECPTPTIRTVFCNNAATCKIYNQGNLKKDGQFYPLNKIDNKDVNRMDFTSRISSVFEGSKYRSGEQEKVVAQLVNLWPSCPRAKMAFTLGSAIT